MDNKEWISHNTQTKLADIKFRSYVEKKHRRLNYYNDDIMCFDIETSSGFLKNGEVIPFNASRPAEYWEDFEKVSLMYVWQFSINGHVFIGRTIDELKQFLRELDKLEKHVKIVYVHNLSFEFQSVLCDLYDAEFDKVLSRKKRKVIMCQRGNYMWRCSYMLTRLSLDVWAREKKLPVKKLTGTIDYTILRTPLTPLDDDMLAYCIHDVLVMYYGLIEYRDKYRHVASIPLTQTGEVRREIQTRMNVPETFRYRKRLIDLIPDDVTEYKRLISVFAGGYTHANMHYSNRTIKGPIYGRDIASSYPYVMCTCMFPHTHFEQRKYDARYENSTRYSYIAYISVTNLKSRLYNTFWSSSRVIEGADVRVDNGRVISASYIKLVLTNVDMLTFREVYAYDDMDIIDFYVAVNAPLSDVFIKYLLELYGNKTSLKGLAEYEALYLVSKQYINSMYGCFVYAAIAEEYIFDNTEGWKVRSLTEELFIEQQRREKKKLSKVFGAYQFGVFVTTWARRFLWRAIIECDKDLIYTDTDSLYMTKPHTEYFDRYAQEVEQREDAVAKRIGVSPDLFAPVDKHGEAHRMGIFDIVHDESRGTISEFKTLGAKKYIYRTSDGLHMTVSGVRKKAVEQLTSIDQFSDTLTFDIDHANKLMMHYNDKQPDVLWCKGKPDEYLSRQRYGICAQPTTYTLGYSLDKLLGLVINRRFYDIFDVDKDMTDIEEG